MGFAYDCDFYCTGVENEFEKGSDLSVNRARIKVTVRFKPKPNLLH